MNPETKKYIKKIIPSVLLDFYFNYINRYGFKGEYKDWQTTQNFSSGYDSETILNKTKNALLKVKNKEAVYERDSFLFDKIEYSWPVLASLLYAASNNDNRLDLLDFGGSLGSSYYQNINFLDSLKELSWSIVEQKAVVKCGQKKFANKHLKFYNGIECCLSENSPTIALFSASLQYLPEPYKILDKLFRNNIKHILIDRLAVNNKRSLITIQNVNPVIYKASYPLWIFKESELLNYFVKNNYELVADFDTLGKEFIVKKTDIKGYYKGYLFKLRKNDL
jgi:putative methyltransferase (TIGR04325 family)